jgi:hypothetical protein
MSTTNIHSFDPNLLEILYDKYKHYLSAESPIELKEFVSNLESPKSSFYEAILLHYNFLIWRTSYIKNKTTSYSLTNFNMVLEFMREFQKKKRYIYKNYKGSNLLFFARIIFKNISKEIKELRNERYNREY